MGKLVIECLDKKLKLKKLARAVCKTLGQIAKFKVEIVFREKDEMQTLNKDTRGVDSVTDVLSYPSFEGIKGEVLLPEKCATAMEGKFIFLGSIVLCEDKIKAQAEEYGHSLERETEYLILHGLMHLFGYDHMTDEDKAEMRRKEKSVLALLYPEEEQ